MFLKYIKKYFNKEKKIPLPVPIKSHNFFDSLEFVTDNQLKKDIDNLNKINIKIVEKIEKEENNSHEIERLIEIYKINCTTIHRYVSGIEKRK